MGDLALLPNTVTKLSGLLDMSNPAPSGWLDLVFGTAMDAFGPERLLFGSDWPVVELQGTASEWMKVVSGLLAGCSETERAHVMSNNAMGVYGMVSHVLRRTITGTDLSVSEISFGAASLGNLFRETSDAEARGAIQTALELGVNYFDTAPHYGLGLSERRLGEVLRDWPRDQVVVSTKVGRLLVPRVPPAPFDDDLFKVPGDLRREWDFSRDGILRSLEASRERLRLDRIDIAYLHDPEESGDASAALRGAEVLVELREQGMLRAVGIGTTSAAAAHALLRELPIDLVMLAGRYTLLEQSGADEMFAELGDRNLIAVGVFNSGLLSTPRPQPDATYEYDSAPQETRDRAIQLAEVAERWGCSLPQLALTFPLLDHRVSSVAIGMRSAEQMRRNLALWEKPVPSEVWADVASLAATWTGQSKP